jgi:hypothetical protein
MDRRTDRHHKKCQSKGGKRYVNGHHNIVRVPVFKHQAWHTLFGNLSAQDICAIINQIWLDPEYKFICVKRERGNSRRIRRRRND